MVEGRRGSVGGEGRGRTRGEKGGRRGRTVVSCWTHGSSRQQQTHPPHPPRYRVASHRISRPCLLEHKSDLWDPRQPRSTPAQALVSNTASGCPLQARDSQRPKAPQRQCLPWRSPSRRLYHPRAHTQVSTLNLVREFSPKLETTHTKVQSCSVPASL